MFDQGPEPELERLVTAFTFSPHLYADLSRLEPHVTPEVWRFLADGGRAHGRLAAFVTDKLGVSPLSPDAAREATEGPRRLWLLPGDVLRRLARLAGIALHAGAIGKVIDRDTVQRIKSALSPDEYDFAINQAPVLTRLVADDPIDFAVADDLSLAFDVAGWRFLKRTIQGLPDACLRRVQLRMPAGRPWDDMEPIEADEAAQQRVVVLVKKLLREIAPQWAVLFA